MSWWESAYRSGHVNWDPGEFDGHLPWLLERFGIGPCRAVDLGCGEGKSAIWLAERGFDVVGIDLSPTAIRLSRDRAKRRGIATRGNAHDKATSMPGSATFVCGSFPEDFDPSQAGFDLAIERGFLQHFSPGREVKRTLGAIRRLLNDGGLFYSLIAAREGATGGWGPRRWSKEEIRRAVEPEFEIVGQERSVFTPGERGSMPAWVTVMRPQRR